MAEELISSSQIRTSTAVDNERNAEINYEDGNNKEITKFAESLHNPSFPDGGWRAWLVILGAMCNAFSTFGFLNSWGTFQAYYQQTIIKDLPPSRIAWIGSTQFALLLLPGAVIGELFDLGYFKSILLTSSVLLITATFLVAQCTQYWHFVISQGIIIGIASGGIFIPTIAIIGQWFLRRRGLAMGCVAVGSSLGGTLLPILIKHLIAAVGFQWTMRIIGSIFIVLLGISNLTLKRRLPPKKAAGGLLSVQALRSAPFTVYCLSTIFVTSGTSVPDFHRVSTYVSVSALEFGIAEALSFGLLSIASLSSIFGQLTAALLSDRSGPTNILILSSAVAGIMIYAWPFAINKVAFIIVIALYGFSTGAYFALLNNPVMSLGPTDDLGSWVGMFMSISAFGALVGPPISGAIKTAYGGFEAAGYYGGSVVMVGIALMVLTRYLVLGRVWGRL